MAIDATTTSACALTLAPSPSDKTTLMSRRCEWGSNRDTDQKKIGLSERLTPDGVQDVLAVRTCRCHFRLTIATLMSDIGKEWTLNASSTTLSSYRKCSKRPISGRSAQATFQLRIDGTTKCSRIVRGFGFGGISGFAADLRTKAGLGFKASAAFPVLKR